MSLVAGHFKGKLADCFSYKLPFGREVALGFIQLFPAQHDCDVPAAVFQHPCGLVRVRKHMVSQIDGVIPREVFLAEPFKRQFSEVIFVGQDLEFDAPDRFADL